MISFISYNSNNRDSAQALAVQLGMLGHDVWFEEKAPGSNASWHQVFQGIHDCDTFVFVATQFSLTSRAQELEFGYARSLGKPILQVLLEDPPSSASVRLSTLPYVDYRHGDDSLTKLADAFTNLPPPRSSPKALVVQPELVAPLQKLHKHVTHLPDDEAAQFALFYNLREFLERHETFHPARNVLLQLQGHPGVSRQVALEIANTFKEVKSLRTKRKALHRRNKILKSAAVVVGVPVFMLGFVKGGQMVPTFFASNHAEVAAAEPAEAEGFTGQAVALAASEATAEAAVIAATTEPTEAEPTLVPTAVESTEAEPTSIPTVIEPTEVEPTTVPVASKPAEPRAVHDVSEAAVEVAQLPPQVRSKVGSPAKVRMVRVVTENINPNEALLKSLSVTRYSLLRITNR
jgi:hypothetical protein